MNHHSGGHPQDPLKQGHEGSLRRRVQKPGLLPQCHPRPSTRAPRRRCLETAAPGPPSGSSSCGQTLVWCCQCQRRGLATLVHADVRNYTLQATFVASTWHDQRQAVECHPCTLVECTLCYAAPMIWCGMACSQVRSQVAPRLGPR